MKADEIELENVAYLAWPAASRILEASSALLEAMHFRKPTLTSEQRRATPDLHKYERRLCALIRHASGMVKAYLRYELSKPFGVVTSGSALDADRSGKLAIAAANENVALWNLRQGTLVSEYLHSSNLLAETSVCTPEVLDPRKPLLVCV